MNIKNCTVSFFLLSFTVLSSALQYLSKGSHLSVDKPSQDLLISPNGLFFAGFQPTGENAYCFGIWFANPPCYGNCTMVWIANRDSPVSGKLSKFSLLEDGHLILTDADQFTSWSSNTASASPLHLTLLDNGNLILQLITETDGGHVLWQSFDFPTDTLLPWQTFTRHTSLVSSRTEDDYSSGSYKLFFDDDNILRLGYDGPESSTIYWPDPWLLSYQAGRSRYNDTRTAVIDSLGYFVSSDRLHFHSSDFGLGKVRRLKLDPDGNLRLYSFEENLGAWVVSWQAVFESCRIPGTCGPNALCSYDHSSGRVCSCLDGSTLNNAADISLGCEFKHPHDIQSYNEVMFVKIAYSNFYGYNINITRNCTLENCERICKELHICKGFWFRYHVDKGFYSCYPKRVLTNGFRGPQVKGDMFFKMPKRIVYKTVAKRGLVTRPCPSTRDDGELLLNRSYVRRHESSVVHMFFLLALIVGGLESVCIFSIWWFLSRGSDASMDGYLQVGIGIRRFSYRELKKATNNFSEVIGGGGSGIVYKGALADGRVAAVKKLSEAIQGEAEFVAETSMIGRFNHMNLIEMWGYCAEGKHWLLVYEYMERGSLLENVYSDDIDWRIRFGIALGVAKALTYLHEECLEWVLHCDVKPQNILLDSKYQPKIADFGLSKLIKRRGGNISGIGDGSKFSKIRGTRGYMAPEWILNLPITSKVDVYSYGVVVLEMVTGKGPANGLREYDVSGEVEEKGMIDWVREMASRDGEDGSWIKQIIDPRLVNEECARAPMEKLVGVAMKCIEEDRHARPSMRGVVEMLLGSKSLQ